MARFLLIHGASHGAWCWDRVVPRLHALGHRVDAIDLPGHGRDHTPRATVLMEDYVARVLDHLEPNTILVGHSFGGFPITLAADRAPDKLRAVVYLCALIPRSGQAFKDFRAEAISSELSSAQTVDREAGVTHVIPEKAGPVFYSDCSEADQAWALQQLTPQPIKVMTEPVNFCPLRVPTHYVTCSEDRVIYPAFQAQIAEGCDFTYDLASDHSPFLSQPDNVVEVLNSIAER